MSKGKKYITYAVYFFTRCRVEFDIYLLFTVYSGNSERLNSEQSLISEHFW